MIFCLVSFLLLDCWKCRRPYFNNFELLLSLGRTYAFRFGINNSMVESGILILRGICRKLNSTPTPPPTQLVIERLHKADPPGLLHC